MSKANQNIRSPFKFLDPYVKKDYDIFFGRDLEVENLYNAVNKNRLVLLYGESGTGKTSVVKCGLANKFEVTDWIPFFIRRGKNLNDSLISVISHSKALSGTEVNDNNYLDALNRISSRYLRPIYLIFDQFEELLILGDEEEKNKFLKIVKNLAESEKTASCHMLFILREEYFASLDIFEKEIPGFSDRRIRIEKMRPGQVEEVVIGTCDYFNITLKDGVEGARQIIKSLSSKSGISLPYLQVYLDMLWREDYSRSFPEGWHGEGFAPVEFTKEEIAEFGAIEDVLKRFLNEQMETIERDILELYPELKPKTIPLLLDDFVTEEGTKRPVNYSRKNSWIIVDKNAPAFLRTLSPEILTKILSTLEQSRILHIDPDSLELAHDRLADFIDQQRTFEQRNLNDILRQIRTGHQVFMKTEEPLTRKQLLLYEDYLPQLNLDDDLVAFVKESDKIRGIEEAKAMKLAEERAEKEKNLREKAEISAKKAKIFSWIASALFIVVLIIGAFEIGHLWEKEAAFDRQKDSLEPTFWEEVEGKNTIKAYQDYLTTYPVGEYSESARKNIESLRDKNVDPSPTPPPKPKPEPEPEPQPVTEDPPEVIDEPSTDVLNLKIGDKHGGGIVFASSNGGRSGMVAKLLKQYEVSWGCMGLEINGATGKGTGLTKTDSIVTQCSDDGTTAAYVCYHLNTGGHDDWFLPSLDELNQIYNNREAILGDDFEAFKDDDFWSSTQADASTAYAVYFFDGVQTAYDKGLKCNIIAVRKF